MKRPYKIAIIDYQMSNIFSITNALDALGLESKVTSDRSEILSCDGAILPGVGSFPEAMKHIKNFNLDDSIKDFINTGKPFMGICLGLQLLFDGSEEIENSCGLGVISGNVKRISAKNKNMRVPHVGWNHASKNKLLYKGENIGPLCSLNDKDYFYFVHSYCVEPDNDTDIYTTTEYSGKFFCSSILKDNIFACQFHPEKSGKNGLRVLNKMFKR
jgi:imidazole glycerol-phosphate synthase subunit HisH